MTQIRLRGPADVVAVLPYQLGYHPRDSIVVVALHDRAVGLIERLDLPAPEHAEEAGRVLVGPLLRERPEAVLLVGYETAEGSSSPALDAVRGQLMEADLDVLDRLVVRDGRWYSIDCADTCCPPEGIPVQAADTPAVAEFVGLEVSPLTGRSAITDLVAADPTLAAAVGAALGERGAADPGLTATGPTDASLSDAARRLRALSGWAVVCDVTAGAAEVEDLAPAQLALLVHSLEDLALRDGLVAWLCPGSLPLACLPPDLFDALRCTLPTPTWHRTSPDGSGAIAGRRLVARLQSLVRSVPDEHATPALTVLANLAWWQGDGALARTCLDRALEALPGYRLALLLERMLDLGVRPGGHGEELGEGVRAG
ncbi:DUF4192 domain-containing protein [Pedococcus bigeumensis]|nr:DUF4192 domain-containing protein [Pedococcus bigeumensis]